jgi:hypothetical protein
VLWFRWNIVGSNGKGDESHEGRYVLAKLGRAVICLNEEVTGSIKVTPKLINVRECHPP